MKLVNYALLWQIARTTLLAVDRKFTKTFKGSKILRSNLTENYSFVCYTLKKRFAFLEIALFFPKELCFILKSTTVKIWKLFNDTFWNKWKVSSNVYRRLFKFPNLPQFMLVLKVWETFWIVCYYHVTYEFQSESGFLFIILPSSL